MKNNTVYRLAFKDISKHLQDENKGKMCEDFDIWDVTPSEMNNKETRMLNAELGLLSINKFGKKMARFKK